MGGVNRNGISGERCGEIGREEKDKYLRKKEKNIPTCLIVPAKIATSVTHMSFGR